MQQQVLGGRYLLKDKVGTGGMATVYRAQDQVLDRTVAVKIMLPQYAADATFAARFKQEAQAAAGLSSPYIVSVYDWGKDGETYYIVMEYLRGTDLKSGIRSHGALDPKKVAQIGSQICAALSVAHKHEIIHRDIKPQNIMVLPDGNIKVMDFGIAHAKNSHLTQDNNVLGTAHYVSPEQTRGQELGPTSDLYSLGVVMYECATGQVPFDGDDAISVALKQVNEQPVPPSQINPNLDADLERIILRCMEKDPANRFQTADELRQTLNAYLGGQQIDVPEPTHVIGGAGTTETNVMSDQTQAMARPSDIGSTAVRGGTENSSVSGGDYDTKKKKGKGKIIAGVIVAIAIIAVIAFAAYSAFSGSSTVSVPNVLGMEQADAVQQLDDSNLTVKVTSGYSDEYDEGEVMAQTPSAGQEVSEGTEVEIQISQGPEPVQTTEVPNLIGCTREEAEELLEEAGLEGVASEAQDDADEGTVFEQDPAADEEVEEGTTVSYTVSTGPGTTSIPNVEGKSAETAASELSDAGFSVSREYEYSSSVSSGVVIEQSLTGSAAPGTTITITISQGPRPQTNTSSSNNSGTSSSGGNSSGGSSNSGGNSSGGSSNSGGNSSGGGSDSDSGDDTTTDADDGTSDTDDDTSN